MQTADSELMTSSTHNSLLLSREEEEKEFAEIAAKISEDFDFKLTFLGLSSHHHQLGEESEEVEEEERDHNEAQVISDDADDDDFSFVINGSDPTLVSSDASIRPYFPLFNRDLLLAHEDYKTSSDHKSVPSKPQVEKIFMETASSSQKNSDQTDTVDGIATGPYCAWEKTSPPELSKKSNSTGFSKLWRFKEYLSRSHSDGDDAFVFLNKPVHKKPAEVKVSCGDGEKKAVKKSKVLSAHEVYLRSKGIHPEHDKRRSYLPYKPEVVGFFTNAGGLSHNVHPY